MLTQNDEYKQVLGFSGEMEYIIPPIITNLSDVEK
jgi:hypothetical protein